VYVGGVGLARGYSDIAQTVEKFIPNPFGEGNDDRLYRTGDLGRWLGDGTLEFLGRNDQQIKIRGYRIELGEVQSALASHEGVRDCVVVARDDIPGDKRLVAYIVSAEKLVPTASVLRAHLRTRLPEYMIPSAYVALEALPETVSGKVDRRALASLRAP